VLVFDNHLDGRRSMINCDSCDRHVHALSMKRIRYRIKRSGSSPFFHAYVFCMSYKSSRDTWNLPSNNSLLEPLSHSSCLCAFFLNTVRPWQLGASLKSRRRHSSYCVRCTLVKTASSGSFGSQAPGCHLIGSVQHYGFLWAIAKAVGRARTSCTYGFHVDHFSE